jgi:hypothetical protein
MSTATAKTCAALRRAANRLRYEAQVTEDSYRNVHTGRVDDRSAHRQILEYRRLATQLTAHAATLTKRKTA